MLRNNLPISRIFGIAFMGISVIFFSLLLIELLREPYYGEEVNEFGEQEIMALFCAVSAFTVGLGMFFTLRWARFIATLAVFCIGAFIIYAFLHDLGKDYENKMIAISGIICTVSLALSFGLLMYNSKLSDEFNDIPLEDEYDEAIDSVLM